MMAYVGQTRSAKLVRKLWELGIWECTARGELPPRRHPYFYDNGAFSDFKAERPFDEAQFHRDIEAIERSGDRPSFLLLPDVVAKGAESLAESIRWIPRLKPVAPLYLCVQNGMEAPHVAPHARELAGLFVGGTLEWKLETGGAWVKAAHTLGLKCHIGRVGTGKRVTWAREINADSIDSSTPLWSEENLRCFLEALHRETP